MTETLKNAVISALNNAFGDEVAIYTESVRQGLKRPCLFVEGDSYSEKHLVMNRFVRTFPVRITYLPSEEDIPSMLSFELDKALEKLFFNMGSIDGFNGSVMESRNKGDCLEFSVQYKTIINKVPDEDNEMMECVKHILSKGSE